MKFGKFISYLGKLAISGFAFFMGIVISGPVLKFLGTLVPAMPKGTDPAALLPRGTDPATLGGYFLIASVFLALSLTWVARGIQGGFLSRWLTLTLFTWVAYGVNTALEASIFMTMAAASREGAISNIAGSLISGLLMGAAVAFLFPSKEKGDGFTAGPGDFFRCRKVWGWAWRLLAAIASFPIIYLFFGWLISPIILKYYAQNAYELTLPGMSTIIAMQLVRSPLFLLASLPILAAWRESRRELVLSLGFALFFLVGGVPLIVAYWFPPVIRITHSLEILADSLAYAWVLAALLGRSKSSGMPPVAMHPTPGHKAS